MQEVIITRLIEYICLDPACIRRTCRVYPHLFNLFQGKCEVGVISQIVYTACFEAESEVKSVISTSLMISMWEKEDEIFVLLFENMI